MRVRHAIGVVAQKQGSTPRRPAARTSSCRASATASPAPTSAARRGRLERLGLADAADRQAKTYSGGMSAGWTSRWASSTVLSVLFLDEPTTGLDPEVRADIWGEIERLAREELMTILLTTHYLDEADRLASQLAIVDRGRTSPGDAPRAQGASSRATGIQIELLDDLTRAAARTALARRRRRRHVGARGQDAAARAPVTARAAIPAVPRRPRRPRRARRASVTVARPSLDDVYLRHAGRSFDRADAEHEAVAA